MGGSTRIPKVIDILSHFFDQIDLHRSINPDEAVAYGAAVQAALISGNGSKLTDNLLLIDANSLSFGIENAGVMTILIPNNTSIPTKRTQTFSTSADNQSEMTFEIY